MGLSPQHGSHEAALTTMSYDRTEVSLSPCAGHRALAATQVSGAAVFRSVMCHLTEFIELYSFGKVPCLSDFVIQWTSWRGAPFAFNHYGLRKGKYLKYCYSIVNELEGEFVPL